MPEMLYETEADSAAAPWGASQESRHCDSRVRKCFCAEASGKDDKHH